MLNQLRKKDTLIVRGTFFKWVITLILTVKENKMNFASKPVHAAEDC